jgi:tetratricopeptide (TPR) repeat protein
LKPGVLAEPILVGRERELAELMCCLDLAIQGKGKTVFVSGEAGAGKTRLVNEFLLKAKKKGIVVLSGWCMSGAAVPYLPFAEAFRLYFSEDEKGPRDNKTARTLQLPEKLGTARVKGYEAIAWLSGFSYSIEPGKVAPASPQVWKDQLFTAVAEMLHSISTKKPVVLLIEDAHWADSASLALLYYVARVTTSERILVLVTFRSEELTTDTEGRPNQLTETIRFMKREEIMTEIKLSNLTYTDVSKLARNMIRGNLQEEFAEKLVKESRGNPLFVVESLRMLAENKALIAQENKWGLAKHELGIPSKVRDIILRRLANLKYEQRRILDSASVIGEEFNVELLSTVLGQDSLEVIETLNQISQSTSIVRVEGDSYRFDHARSREVLYETLSLPLRRGYHGRIAERLETRSKSGILPLADLAYHYDQAQNEEKAIKFSLAAGQDELARWSNTEAAKHFQYVLERIGDSPERFNEKMIALDGLGDAYYAGNNFSQAAKVFDQLANLQTSVNKLRALRKAMFAAYFLGDMPFLAGLTQKAEENSTADRLEIGRLLHQKARISTMIRDDIVNCRRLSEEALKIFEEEYALGDAAWILFTIGALSASDQYERGVASALRSIALYDELEDTLSQMEAFLFTGFTFHGFGLIEEGMQMYEKVIELNEQLKLGDYIRLAGAYAFLSLCLLMRTDIAASISKALKALEYAKKTDSSLYLGLIYELLTVEYAFSEDSVRMEEYFGKLMSLPERALSTTFTQHFFKPTLGVYSAAKNQFEKSNQYFSEFFQIISLVSPRVTEMARQAHVWALSRQGRNNEAKSERKQIEKNLETAQERFRHANVHTSLMTFIHPEVGQIFEMRLDLVNVSKSSGSIVKVENLIVPGLAITEISQNCFVHDETVEFKDKTINSFEVKTVKIALRATKPGGIQLIPRVTYINDLGETKTSSTRSFTINVQPAQPKFEVRPGRVPTGIPDIDALLFGGIPEKYSVVLTGSPCDERERIVKNFLEAGIKEDGVTFYISTEANELKDLLKKHDFYLFLCNPKPKTEVPDLPNVYKLQGKADITNLGIALTKAYRSIDQSVTNKRIGIEILSDVLVKHGTNTTREWISSLITDLGAKGFTILAVMDPEMHPSDQSKAVLNLFDGEISIIQSDDPLDRRKSIMVKKLRNQDYIKNPICLTDK